MLTEQSKPHLLPQVYMSLVGEKLSLVLDDAVVEYEGKSAPRVHSLIRSLAGARDIADLAGDFGLTCAATLDLLAPLEAEALIVDASSGSSEDQDVHEFHVAFRTECEFWRKHIYSQPFWTEFRAGELPPTVALGWGIEFYHYVQHAEVYMPAGVAYSRDGWQVRQILGKHFVEEAGHGELFLDGLVGCGLDRARVRGAPPIAATKALMNLLEETARSGSLAYAACFGLTQSAEVPAVEELERFYFGLAEKYPNCRALFEAALRHSLIDNELGHAETSFDQILALRSTIDARERMAVLDSVRTLAEHFVMWFSQIRAYYSAPVSQVPRRANDFSWLWTEPASL